MLGLIAWLLATSASMWPSGGAVATACVPITPVAPALLSMTTGLPHSSVILSPVRRATRSIAPPGEAGTMIVMLFDGKVAAACAKAGAEGASMAAARAAARSDLNMVFLQ